MNELTITYEETGEVRPPMAGEWFRGINGIAQAGFAFSEQSFPILRQRIVEHDDSKRSQTIAKCSRARRITLKITAQLQSGDPLVLRQQWVDATGDDGTKYELTISGGIIVARITPAEGPTTQLYITARAILDAVSEVRS